MMMFSGRSMGGGRGGRGDTLKTFGRAVTKVGGKGIQYPSSSSSSGTLSPARRQSSNCLSLSSPLSCHTKNSESGLPIHYSSIEGDGFDWVAVDGFEDEDFNVFSDSHVLGNIPSEKEVDDAIFSLQTVFSPVQLNDDNCGLENDVADSIIIPGLHGTTDGWEIGWKEPSLSPYDTGMRLCNQYDEVYHAFHLLQNEPTVQKMVKSLSTDEAVWAAVLNNEVVRELQGSFSSSSYEEEDSESSDVTSTESESNSTTNIVKWMFNSSRVKFKELIEKITKIVTVVFRSAFHKRDEEANFPIRFVGKLRTSFMLSIIVLLVVVVGRGKRA